MSNFDDLETDTGPVGKVAAAQKAAARWTAASYAEDADDLRQLLSALGLDHLDGASPPCHTCGEPISRAVAMGYNRPAGGGRCSICFEAAHREREAVQP